MKPNFDTSALTIQVVEEKQYLWELHSFTLLSTNHKNLYFFALCSTALVSIGNASVQFQNPTNQVRLTMKFGRKKKEEKRKRDNCKFKTPPPKKKSPKIIIKKKIIFFLPPSNNQIKGNKKLLSHLEKQLRESSKFQDLPINFNSRD